MMRHRKTITEFEALVEDHSREIFAYLWRIMRDPQDAEDALQESFLRAFRGFPRLKADSNLRAWLYKIATNVAYTQLKKRARIQSRIADFDDALPPITEPSPPPDETLVKVFAAITSLPHKQRTALLLHKYQGCEYAEIAEILDCREESARANVYQALKKLRQQFAEVEEC